MHTGKPEGAAKQETARQPTGFKKLSRVVAGLFLHSAGAAAMAFVTFLLPQAFLSGKVQLLEEATGGRHQEYDWAQWGGLPVFFLVLVPAGLSLLVTALYGDAGADAAAQNKRGDTALTRASRTGSVAAVRALLAAGGDAAAPVSGSAASTARAEWQPPQSPAKVLWTDKRFALPFLVGAAVYVVYWIPITSSLNPPYWFGYIVSIICIVSMSAAFWVACRGTSPLFPVTFGRSAVRFLWSFMAIHLPMTIFRVVPRIFAIQSELHRAAVTIFLWPCLREIAIMIVRKASFELSHHDERADQVRRR